MTKLVTNLGSVDVQLAELGRIDSTLAAACQGMLEELDANGEFDIRRATILTAALRVAVKVAENLALPEHYRTTCLYCVSAVSGGALICELCDLHGATLHSPPTR